MAANLAPSIISIALTWTFLVVRLDSSSISGEKEFDDDHIDKTLGLQPRFDSSHSNISVVSGKTAILPCSIENLGKYKVAWVDSNSVSLTYEDRRIVDDTRFTVVRPTVDDWHLQVRETQVDDTGAYRCTVNSLDVKYKVVHLTVREPPRLLDSSRGETISEGSRVSLHCNFTGVPEPIVSWSWKSPVEEASGGVREFWKIPPDFMEQNCPVPQTRGWLLEIHNISRHCTGHFVCTADNRVEPVAQKLIPVNVEFAPEVIVTNKRIGQYRNKETILECQIFAHPLGLTFWQKDGEKVEAGVDRRTDVFEHFIGREEAPRSHRRHITISLRIFITNDGDYGTYRCIAENSLGNSSDETILHEIKESSRKMSPSTTERILGGGKKHTKQNGTLPAYRTEAINFRQVLSDELKNRRPGYSKASIRLFTNFPWTLFWIRSSLEITSYLFDNKNNIIFISSIFFLFVC